MSHSPRRRDNPLISVRVTKMSTKERENILKRVLGSEYGKPGLKARIYKREESAKRKYAELEEIDNNPPDGPESRTFPQLDYDHVNERWIVSWYEQ